MLRCLARRRIRPVLCARRCGVIIAPRPLPEPAVLLDLPVAVVTDQPRIVFGVTEKRFVAVQHCAS